MNKLKLLNQTKSQFKFNLLFSISLKKLSSCNNLVKIKHSDLINPNNPETFLFDAISKAYNKEGLGIMVIEQVPGILQKKQKLLKLNHELVNLPESELKKVEKPELNYSVGWSYGKEYLGTKPDMLKASYYAALKPLNLPTNFIDRNIWPEALPELNASFNSIGETIRDIGLIILSNIDKYIKQHYASYSLNYPRIIANSDENTGRMLYYFPRRQLKKQNILNNSNSNNINSNNRSNIPDNNSDNEFSSSENNWCEWHNDHGSLTGLLSAAYFNEDGSEATSLKLTKTGLFVQNRKGEVTRMAYGPEDLAFQVGETLQIHSGGLLQATPHAVKFMDDVPENIARTTFALFMEPAKSFKLNLPLESVKEDIHTSSTYKFIPKLEYRFREGMSFGQFCENTHELYYNMNNKK